MAKTGGARPKPRKAHSHDGLEEQKLRFKHRERLTLFDKIYKLLRAAIGGATIVGVFWCLYASVNAIAGKTTTFAGVARAVVDLSINEYLAYAVGGVAGVAWWRERKLRRRTITKNGKHIKELEERLDPNRKSSGLRDDGTQREADKDA